MLTQPTLTREFHDQRKLIAFICHGGWIPISARILKGKRATGSRGIKDDLENAGAETRCSCRALACMADM